MGRFGSVEISLLYDAPMRKMTVHVLQARGIPCRDKGQPTHTQVSDDNGKPHINRITCDGWSQITILLIPCIRMSDFRFPLD